MSNVSKIRGKGFIYKKCTKFRMNFDQKSWKTVDFTTKNIQKLIFRGAWGDKCLIKVDHAMKTSVMNIPAPVRMTPCPPRLQLLTLLMGVILTGKITFLGDKWLTSWWSISQFEKCWPKCSISIRDEHRAEWEWKKWIYFLCVVHFSGTDKRQ